MGASRQPRGAAFHGGGPVIFLTTGMQLPFERLVRAVDAWASEARPACEICAQVLPSRETPYTPKNFETRERLSPAEYADIFDRASLIVSHAGMGTILTALTRGKRICIMPRQARHGEHRNDHQLATTRRIQGHPNLFKAENETDIARCLDAAIAAPTLRDGAVIDPFADAGLTDRLRGFILGTKAQESRN